MLAGSVFLNTAFFPAVFVFFMARKKIITSIFLESRQERFFPYLITTLFFAVSTYMLGRLELAPVFTGFMAGCTVVSLLLMIVNFRWKASMHMAGMGGITGLILGLGIFHNMLLLPEILTVVLFSGLTGYARLTAGNHTQIQVYATYIFSVLVLLMTTFISR